MDVSHTIIANSDQLNADDIVGGPVTIRIERVVEGPSKEQPVKVHGVGQKPWFPCKTMRRVLALLWGKESDAWVGRSVRLFRDPTVKFGGIEVGGIRISGLSHIERPQSVVLASAKGKKSEHRIDVLPKPAETQATPGISDAKVKAGLLHAVRLKLSALGLGDQDLIDYIAAVVKPGSAVPPLEEWEPARLTYADRHLANGWRTELPAWLAAREVDDGGVMP